jgi:hypothetical protein
MNRSLVIFTCLLFFFSSCFLLDTNKDKPEDFDYGKVENGIYRNNFFKMEISIPPYWSVQTKETMDSLSNVGKRLLRGEDGTQKKKEDAANINTANLLGVFKYEPGSNIGYNAGLNIAAENISRSSQIRNGGDYLQNMLQQLKESKMDIDSMDAVPEKIMIHEKEFYLIHTIFNYSGTHVRQSCYATISRGFCILTVLSYLDDADRKVLEDLVSTMQFRKN